MFLLQQGGLEDLAPVDSIRMVGHIELPDGNTIKLQFINSTRMMKKKIGMSLALNSI